MPKAKKFTLLVRKQGNYKPLQSYATREEAQAKLEAINEKALSKAYKRAEKQGKHQLSPRVMAHALAGTAIQY